MLLISVSLLITAVQTRDLIAILYDYTDEYDIIYTTKGGKGDHWGSFWRPKITNEYIRLGDVALGYSGDNYNPPSFKALLVKSTDGQSLSHPTGFTEIWHDLFCGGDGNDIAVYKMEPEDGYTCLGNAAMPSWSTKPSRNDYYCVKNDYIVRGEFAWTYNDKGTGCWNALSCWTVNNVSNSLGLAGGNFLSVDGYSNADLLAYVLKGDGIKVVDLSLGIKETFITNVEYELLYETKTDSPISGDTIEMVNDSDIDQTSSATLSYTQTTSSSYTFGHAVGVGLSVEVTGGIPLIGEATTTVSASYTFTYEIGKTKSSSTTHEIKAEITLPPRKKSTATIVATKYKADIPFTATIKKVHFDGSFKEENTSGVYTGVSIVHFKVTYGAFENSLNNTASYALKQKMGGDRISFSSDLESKELY